MASKTSRHRYESNLRHCHPVYSTRNEREIRKVANRNIGSCDTEELCEEREATRARGRFTVRRRCRGGSGCHRGRVADLETRGRGSLRGKSIQKWPIVASRPARVVLCVPCGSETAPPPSCSRQRNGRPHGAKRSLGARAKRDATGSAGRSTSGADRKRFMVCLLARPPRAGNSVAASPPRRDKFDVLRRDYTPPQLCVL